MNDDLKMNDPREESIPMAERTADKFRVITGGKTPGNPRPGTRPDLVRAVERCVRGGSEEGDFDIIYSTYYSPLLRYFKRNAPEHKCQDLVHETFLRIWEKRTTIRAPERISGFVFAVARSVLVKSFHDGNQKYESIEDFVGCLGSEEEGPLRLNLSEKLEKTLMEAIQTLPPRTALIARLSMIDGLRNREIADQLGTTDNNVRVLLHGARTRLPEILDLNKNKEDQEMPQVSDFPQSANQEPASEHPSLEKLEDYREGRLAQADEIERHLMDCEECLGILVFEQELEAENAEDEISDFEMERNRRLTWAEICRRESEARNAELQESFKRSEFRHRKQTMRTWAAAACLIAFPTFGNVYQDSIIERLTQPQINATTLHPPMETRQTRSSPTIPEVSTEFFTVVLDVPDSQDNFSVKIIDAKGRAMWQGDDFRVNHGRISLGLSQRFLKEGTYRIQVSPQGSTLVSEFPLDLRYE